MKVEAFGVLVSRLAQRDRCAEAVAPITSPVDRRKGLLARNRVLAELDPARGAGIRGGVEVASDPYVSATLPADTGGVMGHLSRTVRRRVPSIHVIYQRTAAAAPASARPA